MSVSRETLLAEYFKENGPKADRYAQILATWGIERGLIGPKEGPRIWDRHIANITDTGQWSNIVLPSSPKKFSSICW